MKVNAPEKIYVPRLEGNETFVHEWSATKFRKYFSREIAENVEYTRTDAFIEKACEYLMEYEFNDSPTIVDRRKRVDEFVNYMKGK